MRTFWSAGWRRQWPDPQQMAAAVRAGVMLAEPRVLDHDDWVQVARAAVQPATAGRRARRSWPA